jgi:hypothetical protein
MNTAYLNAVDEYRQQTRKKYKDVGGFQDLLVACMKAWEPGVSHRNEVLKKDDRIEWFCRMCPALCDFAPSEFIEAMRMPDPPPAVPRAMSEHLSVRDDMSEDYPNSPVGKELICESIHDELPCYEIPGLGWFYTDAKMQTRLRQGPELFNADRAEKVVLREGLQIDLIGMYNADSDGSGGAQGQAIGWDGLSIVRVFRDGQSPFEILHDGEIAIGWAPADSIRAKEQGDAEVSGPGIEPPSSGLVKSC